MTDAILDEVAVHRQSNAFRAAITADAFARLKQMLARGALVGDIHPGMNIALHGTFSGPELEAIMILMAAAEVRIRPNAKP